MYNICIYTYIYIYTHTPISKVLEQSWRPFTSLKLCKCSQNLHLESRAASNPNKNLPPFA